MNSRSLAYLGTATITGTAAVVSPYVTSPTLTEPITVCWVASAVSQVGVSEAGPNAGPEVESYQASTGNQRGDSWCGSFVLWNLASCGRLPERPHLMGWAPSWFVPKHRIDRSQVRQGDVYGMWSSSKGRIAHVGIVAEVHWDGEDLTVFTVEGNTNFYGSREGDGVYVKRRKVSAMDQFARW